MIRYTVVWKRSVLGDLAEVWNTTSDRIGVRLSADSIDTYLATDPDIRGELLAEELWATTIRPLRVYFTINREDRLVTVVGIVELNVDY